MFEFNSGNSVIFPVYFKHISHIALVFVSANFPNGYGTQNCVKGYPLRIPSRLQLGFLAENFF